MSSQTGPHTPDDVVARLREAPCRSRRAVRHSAVLATARRALRRRRRRQSFAGVVGAGLLALTLAGPVHLAGVGTVTIPGGHQVRSLLGIEDPTGPPRRRHRPGGAARDSSTPAAVGRDDGRGGRGPARDVLPVLEELRPTWYEEGPCDILEYPRGTFSDDGDMRRAPGRAALRRRRPRRPRPDPRRRRAERGPHQRADERDGTPRTAAVVLQGSYAPAAGSSGTSPTCTPRRTADASGRAR